jgi:hypothetical protein
MKNETPGSGFANDAHSQNQYRLPVVSARLIRHWAGTGLQVRHHQCLLHPGPHLALRPGELRFPTAYIQGATLQRQLSMSRAGGQILLRPQGGLRGQTPMKQVGEQRGKGVGVALRMQGVPDQKWILARRIFFKSAAHGMGWIHNRSEMADESSPACVPVMY